MARKALMLPGSDEVRGFFRQSSEHVMLNHGAYGLSPNQVVDKRIELIREQDLAPDVWFRINYEDYYRKALTAAAKFVGSDFEDIFVVDNATTGTNTILKSMQLNSGDKILLTTHSYLAVKNTVDELKERSGIVPVFLEIPIPIKNSQEIVDLYVKHFTNDAAIKLAIIDYITSPSAILMPLDHILQVCEKFGVMSIVDGAHAPGQVKLEMRKMNCDFFVGNFHKWVYGPRSSALLWVAPKHRGTIFPLVTSNLKMMSRHHQFGYMGTRDTSNHFALPTSFDFYESIGGLEALKCHANSIFEWAVPMLCEALGTKPLEIPEDMQAPFMRVISLPQLPVEFRNLDGFFLIAKFYQKYKITAGFTVFNGQHWLRLSINAYNNKNDVARLKKALVDFYSI